MRPSSQGQQCEARGTFVVDDDGELCPLTEPLAPAELDDWHCAWIFLVCSLDLKAGTRGAGEPVCKNVELGVTGFAQMPEHACIGCSACGGVALAGGGKVDG